MSKKSNRVGLLERLDTRRLLAAVAWDGGGDGTNWTDPLNWSGNAVPTTADDVTINVAGTPTIRLAGVGNAGSLTINEKFNFASGDLNFTTAALNGDFEWTGGDLNGTSFTFAAGRIATWSGNNSKRIFTGFSNNGTVNYTGSGFQVWVGSTFSNSGVFNLTGTGDITKGSSSASGQFNNTGTFSKTTATNVATITGMTFNNTGILNILSGGLTINAGGSTTTSINVPTGTSLAFDGGTFNLNGGGTILGGGGTISVESGILQSNQPTATVNNLTVTGGDFIAATNTVVTLGGTFNFTGGDLRGSQILNASATANVTGTDTKRFYDSFRNNGTMNYTGTNFELYGGCVFDNHGTFNLNGAGNITKGSSSADGMFNNIGTFNKSTSASSSAFNTGLPFNNTGSLSVNAGTLTTLLAIPGGGSIQVAANATLSAHSIAQGHVSVAGNLNLSNNVLVSTVTGLDLTGIGTIDINRNALVIDYTGASPINTVNAKVASAFNNGAWNGPGIDSSAIDTRPGSQIGFGEASALVGPTGGMWAGTQVDGSAVLIRTTLGGDANLNLTVDFNDLLIVAQNYGTTGKLFTQGNFNYSINGSVDFNDLLIMAQNYGKNFQLNAAVFSSNRIKDEVVN